MRLWTLIPIVAMLCGCSDRPMRPGTITYIHVVQPDNPAERATIVVGEKVIASVPPAYKPPLAPLAPTPTANALGGLVWAGGALVVLGALGVGLRFIPWTAAFGRILPLGLSVTFGLVGVFLIAFTSMLSRMPWWVIWISGGVIVVVGLIFATGNNWKLYRKIVSRPVTQEQPQ